MACVDTLLAFNAINFRFITDKSLIESFAWGFFLGTFLSIVVNSITQEPIRKAKYDRIFTQDAFLASIAMGLLAGCVTLAIGFVEVGYLESIPLSSIFIYPFSLILFIWASDFWIEILKLILSKVSILNNRS